MHLHHKKCVVIIYIMSYDMASSKISYKSKKVTTRKQYNILIVDDDKTTAEMFKSILKSRGHNVTITHDFILCLNKCQLDEYDVIFMDYHMKEMNGVELINVIKSACNNKSIIFAFTGDDSNTTLSLFRDAGICGAIIKPIDMDVINKLMNLLELRTENDKKTIKLFDNTRIKKNLLFFD